MSLDLFLENPALRFCKFLCMLPGVNLTYPLLRIIECRIILVNHHRGNKTDHILVYAVPVQHVPEHPLNHISYPTLGISNTYIEGHLGDTVHLLTSIVLHQYVSHLRAIPVCYYQVISLPQEKYQVLQCISGVLLLFFNGSHLIASE